MDEVAAPTDDGAAEPLLRLPPVTLNQKLPLWYQASQHLRACIAARRPGDPRRLPAEERLAEHYGISVMTMRQALKELEDEGLITRHRRRGTYAEEPVRRPPLKLLGSVDAVVSQQAGTDVEVLAPEPGPPPPEFAALFPDTPEVVRFRRLRREGGDVTSFAENFVLPSVAARIDVADLARMPMTAVLRDRLGIRIGLIEDSAAARLPSPKIAARLDIALTAPVLYCVGITRDLADRVVDVASIHYRGDRFTFAITFDTR
ncbi:GntR family transcriptional regulator [Streptomyces sp. NPDC004610]|uniref:GntR family transcriptional regulator n=1 Tax=unclassified Streptomyces TaxID=2593676 RepID=UPI0033B08B8E